MKLQTNIPLNPAKNQIEYDSKLLLLGSCFSENIGDKLKYFKFQNLQNPFGTLFHPIAIEKLVRNAITGKVYKEQDLFFLNERWHCFDAHSDLSAPTKQEVLDNLNNALKLTKKQIELATHIMITLGTAWVYNHTESGNVVANCHKVPQKEFEKTLLSINRIEKSLQSILELIGSVNKKAQVVFTVSPVRHLKDGFVENKQSKAHLISSIHHIISSWALPMATGTRACEYFCSYEIMMDELRDYRFYAQDMIHPNQTAVNYIWEKFREVWISPKTFSIMNEVDAVQKGLSHRPFDTDSNKHQKFLEQLELRKEKLQEQFLHITF